MVCYQVLARFAFHRCKQVLVSACIKKQKAKAFLVLSCLPFGHRLKVRRFFRTKKEAAGYVSYLHGIYKNRTVSVPAARQDGQLPLFQEVSN